jgi:hypothetical protein
MLVSGLAGHEEAANAETEAPSAQGGEPAPLRESNARIEALAAEIRAARATPQTDPAPAPSANEVSMEAAVEATIPPPSAAPRASGDAAPRVEPKRLGLIPFVAGEARNESAAPIGQKAWAAGNLLTFARGNAPRIGAIAASLAAIGFVAMAALQERASQIHVLAVQGAENDSLASAVKMLKTKVDALEAAKPRDDTADLRKAIADLKSGMAGSHESGAALAQIGARIDKAQHDDDARFAKLTEKIDRDNASRAADLTARLEKLEKKPAPLVAAAAPAPVILAPGPTTLSQQAATMPVPPAVPRDATGSIAPARPVLKGWIVRDVFNGVAMVEGRFGEREVAVGDMLPGAGRVERIERRGRDWAVVTNLGTIVGESGPQL